MLFRRRTSNFAANNTHPNCAPARAARSKEIMHNPGLSSARGHRRFVPGGGLRAMLSGVIVMLALLVPAYSQEIDPAWYDPWAAPSKTVISTRSRGGQTTKNGGRSDQPRIGKSKRRQAPKQVAIVNAPRKLPRVQ